MRTAEAHEAQLRAELASLQPVPGCSRIKAALALPVRGRIEVPEEPNPDHKRPHTTLVSQWNPGAALRLAHRPKTNNVGSPGGIRTRDLMAENHAS